MKMIMTHLLSDDVMKNNMIWSKKGLFLYSIQKSHKFVTCC